MTCSIILHSMLVLAQQPDEATQHPFPCVEHKSANVPADGMGVGSEPAQ